MTDAVNEAASVISPVNMNSTVKLMRDLGFSDEADATIESYIRQRSDTPRVFDIDSDSRMGDVDDPTFRRRCLEVFQNSRRELTLQQVADIIMPNQTWHDEIVPTLAAASPAELVALLKQNQGPLLNRLVTGILGATGTEAERQTIRAKMSEALTTIANESSVNKLRVKRWGIDVDLPPGPSAQN
jgi:hypothetical protein